METTSPLSIDFSPRPSQVDLIRAVESGMDEVDRILFQAATGSGKTVVIAHLIANILTERLYLGFKQTHTKGGWRCPQANPVKAPPQILFVVHRDKLVKQTIASFKQIFVSRVKHNKKFNERGMDTAITVIKSGESDRCGFTAEFEVAPVPENVEAGAD
jgi:superfamily II DNA or RNA helicase